MEPKPGTKIKITKLIVIPGPVYPYKEGHTYTLLKMYTKQDTAGALWTTNEHPHTGIGDKEFEVVG